METGRGVMPLVAILTSSGLSKKCNQIWLSILVLIFTISQPMQHELVMSQHHILQASTCITVTAIHWSESLSWFLGKQGLWGHTFENKTFHD
jgi:hypothetical protein